MEPGAVPSALNTAPLVLEEETVKALIASMAELNKYAAVAMEGFDISSCTDVTGFGLMGHANEMATASGRTVVIDSARVPLLPQAYEMAEMGIVPKGAYNNRSWIGCSVDIAENVPLAICDILFDPQTSGGLLIALPEKEGLQLTRKLQEILPVCDIIGHVEKRHGKPVQVRI